MQKSRAQIWTELTQMAFLDEALMKRRSLRKQFLNENHKRTTFRSQLWNWHFPRFPKVLTGNLPFVVQDLCILQKFSKRFLESSKVPQKVPREPFPRISQKLSELLFSSKKPRIRRKPRPCTVSDENTGIYCNIIFFNITTAKIARSAPKLVES